MQVIIDNKISGVCVVDEQENLVGILSELDCLRAAMGSLYNNSSVGLVRDHMAADNLVVAHPEEDIVDVAQDMLAKNKRRRPVVENGKLIGQITCRQLLKAIRSFGQ
jgi:CBS domain-containing protein